MSKETNAEIYDLIKRDGLAETVAELNFRRIDDPVLATYVEDVQSLLEMIDTYLANNHEEEVETTDPDEEEEG